MLSRLCSLRSSRPRSPIGAPHNAATTSPASMLRNTALRSEPSSSSKSSNVVDSIMKNLLSIFEHQVAGMIQATHDFQNVLLSRFDISQPYRARELNFVAQQCRG